MRDKQSPGRSRKSILAAVCNILGIGILIICLLVALPLSLPRILGYDAYNIVSGSMEPAIPVGSVIYVKYEEPKEIQEGDVIAFFSGTSVIAHRVTENRIIEGVFVTKGDANPLEDLTNVSYRDVIGVVRAHFPLVGSYLAVFSQTVGKIYVLIFALCGIMFNLLANRLRRGSNE